MEKASEIVYFTEQLDAVTYKYGKLIYFLKKHFLLKNCSIESIRKNFHIKP